ncbi:uncharacterized protein BX663DRAFT_487397 [Cokeromyces recurvatus]|uniref:uncharacterized protein n=1 Tax=Cokeromyces recurvatus TaxID=90255 RepID=UPI0022202F7C|nr:uncharacterized protein BX663DRAFT_487397 [Cokeromyces recurvatus]KAI7901688.1 hypothetical protein BX663DRAFT_487397 [Cokeromyces recurvatus]
MPSSATSSPSSSIRRSAVTSSKRSSSKSINPKIVYDYALRCAIRAHLEQTIEKKNDSLSVSPSSSFSKKKEERQHRRTFSSLSDKFSDEDSKKSGKLTREIVKGLIRRLDDVYKARDVSKPEYLEPKFRTVAKTVKKTLQQEHRYRPSGTIHNVVVLFLKASESELKANEPNPAVWYDDLNQYLARFVEIVIQTVKQDSPSAATPELLDSLSDFLVPTSSSSSSQKNAVKSDNRVSTSSLNTATSPLESLLQFPMVVTIKNLFQINENDHRKKVSELMLICNESALLHDLKKCINNVHTNQSFPGKKEDFLNTQAYENWQKKEVKQLTELINTLMLMYPNLSLSASSEVDVGNTNLLARQSSIDSIQSQNTFTKSMSSSDESGFTFIPADPKGCFHFLMSMCLDYDTENFSSSISEAERSKISAFSQQSDQLLRECWRTWRLSAPFRAILYLNLVKSKFDQSELDIEDLNYALRALDRVTKENDIQFWSTIDYDYLVRVLEGLQNSLLKELKNGLSEYWKISPTWIQDIVDLLIKVCSNSVYTDSHPNPKDEIICLQESIEGAAVERWRMIEELANDPKKDYLSNLFTMADNLNKELISITKKKFMKPIMDSISIPSLVMARQLPYFALEMENWAYSPEFKTCPVDSAFELYKKVLNLEKLYDTYGPQRKTSLFKVESWFLIHVKRWLMKTNQSTLKWVENAIAQDQFQCYSDSVVYSSSIIDLFSMFNQAVDFIADLQWPNDIQYCLFETFLSKIIGEGIEYYCRALEESIKIDIFALNHSSSISSQNENSGAISSLPSSRTSILDKARYQIMGDRVLSKIDVSSVPVNFITPELCIKLNNIETTRGKLDHLYRIMHGDNIAQLMRENTIPQQQQQQQTAKNKYMYTIRVVRAENLRPMDKNGLSDPYVTFEIDGKVITRTKTVYETLNPRWDEEFDIWLSDEAVDVCVIVNDEDIITADEECGVAWFTLSPKFSDIYHQKDDLILNLSPQGSLILRVTMESEKNDIQFWFGKAFRTLRTSANDVAGLIADEMAPYFRHCLSRQVIEKLLGRDKNKFFSVFSRVKNKQQTEPDLQDCEDAITPLLDFLEHNLHILNENLLESNMHLVVLKIWKQILRTLDDVLLPPLSEHISEVKPLDDYELHVVLKWLELLKVLFNGGESGDAIPLEDLENNQYYSILAVNAAYHLSTEQLIDAYHTSKQRTVINLGNKPANRSKSVYHSKNTIRQKKKNNTKKDKRSTVIDLPHGDDILRILRMRHDKHVTEFLKQEFKKRNKNSHDEATTTVNNNALPDNSTTAPLLSTNPAIPNHNGITLTD